MTRQALIREWAARATTARKEAHRILAQHEQARSRVILLTDLPKELSGLPVDVQDYFREACTCLEQDCRRAATVLSWAGFFHVFVEALLARHEADLRSQRPKWSFKDATELKEKYPEAQILQAAQLVGFISKSKLRQYDGLLSRRNDCAHPTLYTPTLNSAVGFLDDMIQQTARLV